MQKKNKIFFLNLLIVTIIFLIDRLSKTYVINLFEELNSHQIFITSFLNVYLIWNEGIAFGLFSSESKNIYNFITVLIIIINLFIIYILFKLNDFRKFFFLIVLGGSLGNLYDRLIYNAVPDFIDFHVGDLHWFIFNPADIFISMGVVCLILVEFFSKNKKNV
ncbi:MAG: signal peptidase II [Candidatus Pelagibacter sp.]